MQEIYKYVTGQQENPCSVSFWLRFSHRDPDDLISRDKSLIGWLYFAFYLCGGEHLLAHDLDNYHQYAYKTGYSTKTAFISMKIRSTYHRSKVSLRPWFCCVCHNRPFHSAWLPTVLVCCLRFFLNLVHLIFDDRMESVDYLLYGVHQGSV